jgi:hypothetical protein
MQSSDTTNEMSHAVRVKLTLSIFWTMVLFNYVYADIFTFVHILIHPPLFEKFQAGSFGSGHLTKEFMLAAAAFMEIPIAMVLLSWVLPYGLNRAANILSGLVMTGVIIFTLVWTLGKPEMAFYALFEVIEILSTSAIVWIALTWRNPRKR